MRKHTKLYMDHFKYDKSDFIPCEVCGSRAVDIHHIESRGMGGTKIEDSIENLMAVCRDGHLKFGDKKQYLQFLKDAHNHFINSRSSLLSEPCKTLNI